MLRSLLVTLKLELGLMDCQNWPELNDHLILPGASGTKSHKVGGQLQMEPRSSDPQSSPLLIPG